MPFNFAAFGRNFSSPYPATMSSETLPDEPAYGEPAYGSQSGSDSGSHQDASVLYAKPVRRGKTRTYSEVRSEVLGEACV